MPNTYKEVLDLLRSTSDPKIAEHSQRFFKTGEGEYGENDQFLGIRVPKLRKLVKQLNALSLEETSLLLKSPYHEARLLALLMLVDRYPNSDSHEQRKIFEIYVSHTKYINNWDLVDSSAHYILGAHLENRERNLLYEFAESNNLWQRRIAILTTLYFIKRDDFEDALKLSEILLDDNEDLIHKAVGWMLREIGKREKSVEDTFLIQHYRNMPRTMLRYAIEKHPPPERQAYLKGLI